MTTQDFLYVPQLTFSEEFIPSLLLVLGLPGHCEVVDDDDKIYDDDDDDDDGDYDGDDDDYCLIMIVLMIVT